MNNHRFSEENVFAAQTVSEAWAKALVQILDGPGTERLPCVFVIAASHGMVEIPAIRAIVDSYLEERNLTSVKDVAWTIFPYSLRQYYPKDRHAFFDAYRRHLPRYVAANRQLNGRGLYFSRLVGFDLDPNTGKRSGGNVPCQGNQLEFILSQRERRGGVRQSMFQASIFDPARDHSPQAQLGFPCLQHVTFAPSNGALHVNAFYATQQLVRKGYGNFLGLFHLGAFMAAEMGLRMGQLVVNVGVEKLGGESKNHYRPLAAAVKRVLEAPEQ